MSRESCIKVLQDVFERDMACVGITLTHEALEAVIEYLKDVPSADVPHWIPCSERLPKYGKNVLITNDKGNVRYGRFRGVEFWKEDGDSYWTWKQNTIEHVLAWMPLPEPYKDGEQE